MQAGYWILPGDRIRKRFSAFCVLYQGLSCQEYPNPYHTLLHLADQSRNKKINPVNVLSSAILTDGHNYDLIAMIEYSRPISVGGSNYFKLGSICPYLWSRDANSITLYVAINRLPISVQWRWTPQMREDLREWTVQRSIDNSSNIRFNYMVDRLKYCVRSLLPNDLDSLLAKLNSDDYQLIESRFNIINWIIRQLRNRASSIPVRAIHLRNIHSHPRLIEDIANYLLVFTRLVKQFSHLIKDDHIQSMSNVPIISSILIAHGIRALELNPDEETGAGSQSTDNEQASDPIIPLVEEVNGCYICTDSDNLIESPCLCKSYIHLDCLITMTIINGNTCKTCAQSLHPKTLDDKIYYPRSGVYIDSAGSYITIPPNHPRRRLHYAVIDRDEYCVRAALDRITTDQLRIYFRSPKYRSIYQFRDSRIHGISHSYAANSLNNNSIIGILNEKIREFEIVIR